MSACDVPGKNKDLTTRPIPQLLVIDGYMENGYPTAAWIEAIHERHDEQTIKSFQEDPKPLSREEQLWAELIKSKIPKWTGWIDSLSIPFNRIEPPREIIIVIGNAGGADAFTASDTTIGFNLNMLHHLYGGASENKERIDRFFAHEMTHILHKAWRKAHPIHIESPLEYALWDCLVEGIGNYRSLSQKWVSDTGELTELAEAVLTELQPVFVERLIALEDATEAEAAVLLQGLSSGPFSKKWGALTSALWLAQEARGNDARLQPWIEAGPWGIIDLANKYLPVELRSELSAIEKG